MLTLIMPSILLPLEAFLLVVVPTMSLLLVLPEATNTNVLIATTIVGFLTMVVQQGFSAYNLRKLHRDDIEDRTSKAKELAEQYKRENEKTLNLTELRAHEVRLLVEQRQLEAMREQREHMDSMKEFIARQGTESKEDNTRVIAHQKNTEWKTESKLDEIHTLVNSNMTAALESELSAHKASLALLEETITLKNDLGTAPSRETLKRVQDIKRKIAELEAKLRDRA